MIIYTGETDLKELVNQLIDEMLKDEDFKYTIQVYESRENEKLSKFMFEVSNIEDAMPNF